MAKTKLTSTERAMAARCYCPQCGAEMEKCSAGGLCPQFSWARCTNGRIDSTLTDKHFKALRKVKRWQEETIDTPRQI